MWPTPTAGDGKSSGNTPGSKAHFGISLTDAVRRDQGRGRTVPTPAARDYRYPNKQPYAARGGGKKGEQLPNAMGGPLNPAWVEWLMGFPPNWTKVEIPKKRTAARKATSGQSNPTSHASRKACRTEWTASEASATRLSPKLPK